MFMCHHLTYGLKMSLTLLLHAAPRHWGGEYVGAGIIPYTTVTPRGAAALLGKGSLAGVYGEQLVVLQDVPDMPDDRGTPTTQDVLKPYAVMAAYLRHAQTGEPGLLSASDLRTAIQRSLKNTSNKPEATRPGSVLDGRPGARDPDGDAWAQL